MRFHPSRKYLLAIVACLVLSTVASANELIALYDFQATSGSTVHDVSGQKPPLDLIIRDPAAVTRTAGSLTVNRDVLISGDQAPQRLLQAVRDSGEITVEAWVRAASPSQEGPARIVSLSKNTSERNFTLGQENDRFDFRFRSTKTDRNGIPSVASPRLDPTKPTHLVYVRDHAGTATLFINGKSATQKSVAGNTDNWADDARLTLANELTNDRPWHGSYYGVAIFSRALSANDVATRFAKGHQAIKQLPKPSPKVTATKPAAVPITPPAPTNVQAPLVHYDFQTAEGNRVRDLSGNQAPFDLNIVTRNAVSLNQGALTFHDDGLLRSDQPPQRLIKAVADSGELTVEAWVQAANADQEGPARIVSLSIDTLGRNFTLGQEGDRFDFRCRTTSTGANGTPSLETPKLDPTKPHHLVYSRDRDGNARFFVDGRQVANKRIAGTMANWDPKARLVIGNEVTRDRPWLGSVHQVAIFARSLSADEIAKRFALKADQYATIAAAPVIRIITPADGPPPSHLFELEVAPIIANHCVECHDPATSKGDLDLTTRKTALAGGEEGPAIVPGNLAKSLLWQSVESDDMPHKRDPLSASQKATLKTWIEKGAPWTADVIDPAVYASGAKARQNWVRRLTIPEYVNTVRAIFEVEIETEARAVLPPDLRADGFSNTAYNLTVDFKHVKAYAELAELTAKRLDAKHFAKRFSSSRRMIDKDMIKLIENMGEHVLRGPLNKREVAQYRGLTTSVMAANGTFDEAIRYLVEAMMQSPRFIYRMENQDSRQLDPYALASRISYIVWGGPPDASLLKAAAGKRLGNDDELQRLLARMLTNPQAEGQAMRFAREWLHLDRLANLRPDPTRFPEWKPELAGDMQAETLAFFKDVAWQQDRPLADLFNAQLTYATPALARHYGLPPADTALVRYDLTKVPARGGLLTHGSILTVGGDDASMVTRGLFVLHDVLRGVVKSPPAGVDTTPIPAKPGRSNRFVAETRIKDKSCGGCHSKFEPMAFAFEKYNGLGVHADRDEHGNLLREDGSLLIPGTAKPIAYSNSAELMNLLAASDRVKETLTWKLTQFAVGRPLGAADRHAVAAIHQQALAAGGTYRATISAICLSNLIRQGSPSPADAL